MSTYLSDLAAAISDIGVWTWWADEDMPSSFQLEFAWVQLLQDSPREDSPPGNQVALRFLDPKVVAFLQWADIDGSEPAVDWPVQLKNDTFDIEHIVDQQLTLSDHEMVSEILGSATVHSYAIGDAEELKAVTELPAFLVFRCATIGLAIGAESFQPLTFGGQLSESQVSEKYAGWWSYWQRYWEVRDSPSALPNDPICEVTIPLSGEK